MSVVRELIAILGFKLDKDGLAKAEAAFDSLKAGALALAGTAAIAGGSILGAIKSAADAGDEAVNQSVKLGITAESYQALAFAAGQAGVEMGTMAVAIKTLQQHAAEAARGNKGFLESFKLLGISVKDAGGNIRPTMDMFADAAKKISGTKNESERLGLAIRAFGARAGQDLMPLLSEGPEGFAALIDRAKELGGVLSNEDAAAAEAFGDSVAEVEFFVKGAIRRMGVAFIPWAKRGVDWLIANRVKVATAIEGTVRGIGVLGSAALAISPLIIGLVDVVSRLAEVIQDNGRYFIIAGGVIATYFLPQIMAATVHLLNLAAAQLAAHAPLIAYTAAALFLAAVIEDVYEFTKGGRSAIGDFLEEFTKKPPGANDSWIVWLVYWVMSAWKGITDAARDFTDWLADTDLLAPFRSVGKWLDETTEKIRKFGLDIANAFAKIPGVGAAGKAWGTVSGWLGGGPEPEAPPPYVGQIPARLLARGRSAGIMGPIQRTENAPLWFRSPTAEGYVPDSLVAPMESWRARSTVMPTPPSGGALTVQGGAVSVQVNAAPGMSAEEVAELAGRKVAEAQAQENARTARQLGSMARGVR